MTADYFKEMKEHAEDMWYTSVSRANKTYWKRRMNFWNACWSAFTLNGDIKTVEVWRHRDV